MYRNAIKEVIPRSEIGEKSNIAIIILAAGSSSRMGKSKQFLDISGEALLTRSAKEALKSKANKVIVVLGHEKEKHEMLIEKLPVEIFHNSNWQSGMGSSLKAGISHLALKDYNAVIIMVCDQPLISSAHLDNLIETYFSTGSKLVASSYDDTFGVPALFDKSLFTELLQLENGQGAKKIIQNYSSSLRAVDFPEGAIDLDTNDDYIFFTNNFS